MISLFTRCDRYGRQLAWIVLIIFLMNRLAQSTILLFNTYRRNVKAEPSVAKDLR